jgi:ATP-dependent RNA helicase DeaD
MTATDPLQGVPEPLAEAMRARGFSELTSVQRNVLDSESSGRDLRISSQTGSGKTAALGLALAPHFIAAAAQRPGGRERPGPSALVIAPTRELAIQVAEELRWLYQGIRGLQIGSACSLRAVPRSWSEPRAGSSTIIAIARWIAARSST